MNCNQNRRGGMSNRKKSYEKPTLKGVNMLETGAGVKTCCKSTTSSCKNAEKSAKGKQAATSQMS